MASATAVHPALQAVSSKYRTGPVSDSVKYEPSFIQPDGKVIYLGTDWHPTAIEKTGTYPGTDEGRTQFINETGAIRVRPNMQQREGETFHFTLPKTGVTPQQVAALKQTAATARYGNLMFETADTPSLSRNNMRTPKEWQYKSANDVEGILAKLGVLPGQKVSMSDAYGETGKYVGGHEGERVDLGEMESSRAQKVRDRAQEATWESQAKGEPEGVTNAQKYARDLGVTKGTALMPIPQHLMTAGGTPHDVGTHELAHAVVADITGIPTEGSEVRSHLHPDELGKGSAAVFKYDILKMPGTTPVPHKPGFADFSHAGLKAAWPKFLKTYVAGGVAQELVHGIPFEKNEGLAGDLGFLRSVGENLGFTPEETQGMMDGARQETKELLNHPAILDILKTNAGTREDGLSKTLLHSAAKVQDVIRQVREVQSGKASASVVEGNGGDAGAVVSGAEPGGAGAGAQRDVRGGDGKAVSPVQGTLFAKKGVKPAPGKSVK